MNIRRDTGKVVRLVGREAAWTIAEVARILFAAAASVIVLAGALTIIWYATGPSSPRSEVIAQILWQQEHGMNVILPRSWHCEQTRRGGLLCEAAP